MDKSKFKFGVSFTSDTTQVDKTVAELQARLEAKKKILELQPNYVAQHERIKQIEREILELTFSFRMTNKKASH